MYNKKQRNPYFDILRGVAIIFVVGIHTFPVNSGIFGMAVRQLVQCAVPLFIAISGYFIGKKTLSTGAEYFSFLRKQLPRVYIPMLVWSLPWIFLDIRGGSNPAATILFSLAGGMCVFYFVPLIMQYYALTPFVQWAVREHTVSGGNFFVADVDRLRLVRLRSAHPMPGPAIGAGMQPISCLVPVLLYRRGGGTR